MADIVETSKKVVRDDSKTIALLVGLVFLGLYLLGIFIPAYMVSMGTIFFIFLLMILIWAGSKIVWTHRREGLDLEKVLVYILVIAGVVVIFYFFPNLIEGIYSIKAVDIMSIVPGVG